MRSRRLAISSPSSKIPFVSSSTRFTKSAALFSAASICPIVAVLTLGIYVQFKVKREERRLARELALEGETK